MIRLVIFDFDGTLFDTREDIADAVNHARRWFGKSELSLPTVTTMVGFGVQTLARRSFEGTGVDPDAALEKIMEYYTVHPGDKSQLYPGVRETLPRIRAIRTIVSNKPEALVRDMLRTHQLEHWFSFVAGGDTFPVKKPDPMPVRFLQSRFGLENHEILVVGDHSPDIQMARSAGCPSIFCRYGFFAEDTSGAQFQIDRFEEVVSVIEQLDRCESTTDV